MSVKENKVLVKRYVEEVWNKGNVAQGEEFIARDIVVHDPPMPGVLADMTSPIQKVTMFRAALPNLNLTNDYMFGEGDKVVQRWIIRGTHTGGDLFGIPATGKQLTITGISEFRVAGGKIVETWGTMDNLSTLQDLGVVPKTGGATG